MSADDQALGLLHGSGLGSLNMPKILQITSAMLAVFQLNGLGLSLRVEERLSQRSGSRCPPSMLAKVDGRCARGEQQVHACLTL